VLRKSFGFTLMELMVAVAIIGILAALAAPSFNKMLDRNRLKGAAEGLFNDLQLARTEAIKRNQDVDVTFSATGPTTTWAYGLRTGSTCDPSVAISDVNACQIDGVLKITRSTDYPGVSLETSAFAAAATPVALRRAEFEPRQGTADVYGTAVLTIRNDELRVIVNILGRVRICTTTGMPGYQSCT